MEQNGNKIWGMFKKSSLHISINLGPTKTSNSLLLASELYETAFRNVLLYYNNIFT